MSKIEYLGKSLLITKDKEKTLVLGDLHLGYAGSLRESGYNLPIDLYKEIIEEMDLIFSKTGKVDKIILLGDLKHEMGKILSEEWQELLSFFDYLEGKAKEIIIVRGNHDKFLQYITDKKKLKIEDYFISDGFCFLHGDRDFEEIYNEKIEYWIMGHGHPAIVIEDDRGAKKEKYKCFLTGEYKGKNIIVLPSFFDVNEGTDVVGLTGEDLGLAWDFNLRNFEIKVVEGEKSLNVLDFGKLRNI